MTLNQAIGKVAEEARTARNWSRDEMAVKIGCCTSTVRNFEIGVIAWSTLVEFSQVLKISPGGLISLAEEMIPQFEAVDQNIQRMLTRFDEVRKTA